ncbi:MAG: dihydrolipoyl dehydrogenase [Spirochaeta sp.]|nr:dihydrolipoyl dehydrogenase [Spirochaeta sp.]
MAQYDYDLLVIGAGPGGYVAAIRASQLGLSAAVIEKDAPGGVCLNWGCIPSKALIHQAEIARYAEDLTKMGASVDMSGLDYSKVHKKSRDAASKLSKGVQALLKKNKVEYISGEGKFSSAHEVLVDGEKTVTATNILIATGSRSKEIPGFEFDGKKVLSSRDILDLTTLPKKLVILGAGAIGMEFAYVMSSFGVEVTIVEMLDQLLPLEDADAVDVIAKAFKRYGVDMRTGTKAKSLSKSGKGVKLSVEGPDGAEEAISADMILVAVGRAPNTESLGLETIGVGTDKGFVTIGDYYQTSVPGVYAIGDVVASPLLAHVASKEGEIAVEHMAGNSPETRIDPMSIPSAVYCEPEIGSFGLTEKKAQEQGVNFEIASFPYRGAGKSVAVEKSEGIVKIVLGKETREILGAHVAGYNATELIHELLLAKNAELLPEDIARMIHAHPTLSEAVMEGARASEGWAIHF